MAETILIVDDDPELRTIVATLLHRYGFSVFTASDGETALSLVPQIAPDLIVLDVSMPGMSGHEVCRKIRQQSTVPILFLSAIDTADSVVTGLMTGGDDYITKPFRNEELLARIHAILRRARMAHTEGKVLRFAGNELVINVSEQRVFVRGDEVSLSPLEYNLLVFMAERAGRVLTPELLFEAIWGPGAGSAPNQVKWYIWRLRQKIEADPTNPQFILTVRGKGYLFSPR